MLTPAVGPFPACLTPVVGSGSHALHLWLVRIAPNGMLPAPVTVVRAYRAPGGTTSVQHLCYRASGGTTSVFSQPCRRHAVRFRTRRPALSVSRDQDERPRQGP
eukprot:1379665-Alexandrium_andersonii.AAC.1